MKSRRSFFVAAAVSLSILLVAPLFANGSKEQAQAEPVKQIDVWMIHHPIKAVMDAFDEQGAAFTAKSGVTVNYVRIPTSDFHNKLVTSISAQQYPDVAIWNISPGLEFSQTGAVHEMSDVLATVGKDRFNPDTLKMFQYPVGKQWELPLLARLAGYHYRKDWLQAAGFDPNPVKDAKGNLYVKAYDTWDDLLATSMKLTHGDQYGAGFQYNRAGFGDSAAFAFSVITSFGGHFLDPVTGKVAINSPETVAAFTFLKKLYDSGAMPKGVTTWDGYANNLYFTNGTVGLVLNSNSILPGLKPTDKVKKDEIGITVPPAGPRGRMLYSNPDTVTIFNTKGVEASKAYAEFLFRKDTQLALFKTMGVGYYGPLLLDVINDPAFDSLSDQDRMFLETNKYLIGLGWPGAPNPKLTTVFNSYVLDDALSRISVDGWSPEKTVQEMEKKIKDIMEQ